MNMLKPRSAHHICFYMNRVSGHSDWLTSDQVIENMGFAMDYETVEVESIEDIEQYGELWYGIRLRVTTEEAPEEEILWNGQVRTLAKRPFQQEDHNYYFNFEETRDVVRAYLKDKKYLESD
jgi:hypothetical protein